MTARRLTISHERFKIRGSFTISRGSKTHADIVTVTIEQDGVIGRGECVPYARYDETIDGAIALVRGQKAAIEAGMSRRELQTALPPGAARNALDCALWDLEAKLAGRPAWELAGLTRPAPLVTAFTISLGTPAAMATAAATVADKALLKLKLGGEGDLERLAAVREAAPRCRLIVDANEAWRPAMVEPYLAAMAAANVELVEQPLPAGEDGLLAEIAHPVPLGADESVRAIEELEGLTRRYDVVNLKLDKVGGLTEALRFVQATRDLGLGLMVGCMLCTSLGTAPAMLVAQRARFVDLDGPLLLEEDREPPLHYEHSTLFAAAPELWG